jgi:hypothetical protein
MCCRPTLQYNCLTVQFGTVLKAARLVLFTLVYLLSFSVRMIVSSLVLILIRFYASAILVPLFCSFFQSFSLFTNFILRFPSSSRPTFFLQFSPFFLSYPIFIPFVCSYIHNLKQGPTADQIIQHRI